MESLPSVGPCKTLPSMATKKPQDPPQPSPIVTLARGPLDLVAEHPGLAVAALSFFLVAAKVAYTSGFNTNVAMALVSSVDGAQLVLALAISIAPLALGIVALAAWVAALDAGAFSPSLLMAVGLSGLAVLVVPVIASLVGIVSFLVTFAFWVWQRRHRPESYANPRDESGLSPKDLRVAEAALGATVVLLVSVVAVLLTPPLYPSERLSFTDGRTLVGFVVDDQAGWFKVLGPDHHITQVPVRLVDDRVICDLDTSIWQRSGVQLFFSGIANPPC
jgi:hypothetical protein